MQRLANYKKEKEEGLRERGAGTENGGFRVVCASKLRQSILILLQRKSEPAVAAAATPHQI